jgi:hypothetical protein
MINLLPLEEKNILKTEEKWRLILLLGILILFFFICLILILFSIKIYISSEVESQKATIEVEGKEFEKQEVKELREKISITNKKFSQLNNFYQNQVYLTKILERISGTLLPNMYLTNMSYEKETSKIFLSGFAPNKEILFEFKKNLEETFSTKVDVDNQSWIKPTDFRITFKIEISK